MNLGFIFLAYFLNEFACKATWSWPDPSAPGYVTLLGQTTSYWSALNSVQTYGHIPLPLVYTQVGYTTSYWSATGLHPGSQSSYVPL